MTDTPTPDPVTPERAELLAAVPAAWFRQQHADIDEQLRAELDLIETERPTAPARTFARGLAFARAYGAMRTIAGELVARAS